MINTSLFALFGRYKGDASLAGVLENIQRGTYKQFIDETREALASGDKERAAKLKKKLPAFTPQATYSGKRLDPHITRYNQLVVLDIDHVGERELERITPLATEAPYTVAYFRSPSGDGAKLIAYAATDETATPGNHRRVYEAMSRWYAARLGVELDTSGSDIGRLCFVSDDPALYLSPAYRPWLEGTGELPEGLAPLPLTWKEEVSETAPGAKERKVASPLENYISERFLTRKNGVRGYVEVATKKKRNGQKPVFKPVTDYWVNSLWRSLLKDGHYCSHNDIRAILMSDFSETFHPFRSYFEGLAPWDGVTDWIGQLADTVDTTRPAFWRGCLKRWLIAQVAGSMELGVENHTILLLAGGQGLGKTSWLRNLVPPELRDYLFTGNVNPYSKGFPQMMVDCLLIVIDEMSGQSYADLNRLKALTSTGVIYLRRPYGHYAETQIRHASFAATVNDLQSLPDDNESRRFLCFEATRIDYQSPVRHADIYAQALALFRRGEKYWFSGEDIRKINENNETFRQRSPEEELFFTYFRKPERFDTPQYLTASDIMTKLSVFTRITPTRSNIVTLSKVLKKHGFKLTTIRGKRLFEVVEITPEQVKDNFLSTPEEKGTKKEDEKNHTDNQNNTANPKLPF